MLANHTIIGFGKYVCVIVAAFSGLILSSCGGGGGGGGGVAALGGGGSEALTSLLPEGKDNGNLSIQTQDGMLELSGLQLKLIGETGDAETYSVEGIVTFNTKKYNLSNQYVYKHPSKDGFYLEWKCVGEIDTAGKAALDIREMFLRLKETQEGERQGEVQVKDAQFFYFDENTWRKGIGSISEYLNGSTVIIKYN